jgi:hypothetical protein
MKVAFLNDGPVTILIDSKIENNEPKKQLDVDTWIKRTRRSLL